MLAANQVGTRGALAFVDEPTKAAAFHALLGHCNPHARKPGQGAAGAPPAAGATGS